MRSRSRAVFLALLLVGAATGVAAGAAGTGVRQAAGGPLGTTEMAVELQADGDARWMVSTTLDLSTANETAAFRRLATEFERGTAPTLGLPAFRRAASEAATATGREMEITAVNRTVSPETVVANGTGRLTLRFTWTSFARVTDDRLTVGDVFRTGDGAWLTGLSRGQTLVIRPPEGYGLFDASDGVPAPRNGTLRWRGPTEFEDSLSVTFTGSTDGDGGGDGTDGGGDGTDGNGETDPNSDSLLWVGAASLAAGVVVAYVLVRRRDELPSAGVGDGPDAGAEAEHDASDGESEPPSHEPGVTPDTDAEPDSPEPGDADVTGAADASGDSDEADEAEKPGPEPDEVMERELLSDEERVERLLEHNGGRMKQANIVKETGWSNAKVSQLLSAMDEDDRIDKLRIGRENLISFPDEEVTDLDDQG